ncbi:MAG: phage tail tape measure protein [Gammaproteobacteria bacterium]|nr:MAG: phage tail tape measure protein [Gammaproteobacteria bacterium]
MSKRDLKLSIEIENNVTNIDEAEQYIDSLKEMGLDIEHLRKRSAQLVESWDKLKPNERAQRMRRLREAMISTANGTLDLKRETAELAKSSKKAAKNTEKLRQQTGLLDKTYGKLRNKVIAVGGALVTYFSVAKIANFFSSATDGAANLEAQLDKVQAVSGATAHEMRQIEQASNQLGSTTKYTATQAAEGFEILARAGLNASESVTAIPAVMNLAQAAGIELAESAGYITKAIAGMNLKMAESGHVADVLARAAASANTDVSGLGQALSYAAPSANALGVSLEDTVAIIGKFADAGIDASRAGTALNSILAQFSNPASKFRQELTAIGITTDNFVQALHDLAAAGKSGSNAILSVGQEAGPALKALLAQGMPALDELSNKLKNADGAAANMAATMNDNLPGAITGLGSVWDALKNTLGKPLLKPVTEKVKRLADIIREFVNSGKVEALGKVFAAEFNKMADSALNFITSFNLSKVSGDIGDFTDKVSGKLEKLGAVLGGIYNTFATFGNAIKTGTYAIGNAFSQMGASIAGVIPGLDGVSSSLQKFADDTAVKVVIAGQDLIDSSTRLRENYNALTKSIEENRASTEKNTVAISEEVKAFNQKSARLAELRQLESEYISSGRKNTQEYNDVVKQRINLEGELAEVTKNKVLLTKEDATAQEKQTAETAKSNKVINETAEIADKAADSTKKQGEAAGEAAKKTTENAEATKENTQATKENAEASDEAAEAAGGWAEVMASKTAEFRAQAEGLVKLHGANKITAEQYKELADLQQDFVEKSNLTFYGYHKNAQVLDNATQKLIEMTVGMREANEHMQMLESKIADGTITTNDLERAFIQLDNATLNKLNATIDKAKQKIQDLADEARKTAEDLDAELARLKGDDSVAQELEQKRKLAELEEKLAKARERQNIAEIEQYERAIELQRQIYAEKKKQYEEDKKQQAERDKQAEERRKKSENKRSDKTQNDSNSSSIAIDEFNLGELPPVKVNTDELANKFVDILGKEREKTARFTLNTFMDDIEREAKARGL